MSTSRFRSTTRFQVSCNFSIFEQMFRIFLDEFDVGWHFEISFDEQVYLDVLHNFHVVIFSFRRSYTSRSYTSMFSVFRCTAARCFEIHHSMCSLIWSVGLYIISYIWSIVEPVNMFIVCLCVRCHRKLRRRGATPVVTSSAAPPFSRLPLVMGMSRRWIYY